MSAYHSKNTFPASNNNLFITLMPLCIMLLIIINHAGCSDGNRTIFPFLQITNELSTMDAFITTPANTSALFELPFQTTFGGNPEFVIESGPSHGTLRQMPLDYNRWEYTPDIDFNGVDVITFHATYGTVTSNTSTITIAVGNAYYTPTAFSQRLSTPEDTPVEITLRGSDPENDPLTYHISSYPIYGTLMPHPTEPNMWIYTPPLDFVGTDQFTFYAYDGMLQSPEAIVTIDIGPVNDRPSADNMTIQTEEDTECSFTLIAHDTDGDALTYHIDIPPSHGTLIQNGSNCVYIPNVNFHGSDSFSFHVNDGYDDSDIANVGIQVTPVNDAPIANGSRQVVRVNTSKNFSLSGRDPDGDSLTYVIDETPSHGSLNQLYASEMRYTPDSDYRGYDSFTFHVEDGSARSDTVSVPIVVVPNGVIFIRANAPDGGDGACWETAFNTIQDGIDGAETGDQLWIARGTYSRTGSFPTTLAKCKPGITLLGGFSGNEFYDHERDPATNRVILDGMKNVYHVIQGASGTTIDGLEMRGGEAKGSGNNLRGAGMINIDCNPTIRRCIFTLNKAHDSGGGMYNYNASPTIIDCLFINNEAANDGGGIYSRNGSHPVIENTIFSQNTARLDGGGIYVYYDSFLTISNNSILTNNDADEFGGGICSYGTSTIRNCTFTSNQADNNGGAICSRLNTLLIENCIFNNNSSMANGGAVYTYNTSIIKNSVFSENHARNGGGLYIDNSNVTILNCSYQRNVASGFGGGICIMIGGNQYIYNSNINYNTANPVVGSGGGIYRDKNSHTEIGSECSISDNAPDDIAISP